ncbi:DUF6585 family protein [Nocardia aurantia]|uniref:Uncharacterized protein n=1 Tax=Nocardia aurantia TaxID=2585199 RepID=A0A7K0DGY2_9NOCA|nr:DUF6585 family protein [Nocardia aurantia]MQY24907.1 hypothetical protein [Nocardia aurantia]
MTTPSTQRGAGGTDGRRTVPLTQLIHLMSSFENLGEHRQTYLRAPASGDPIVRGCGLVAAGLAAVSVLCIVAGAPAAAVVVILFALIPTGFAALRNRRGRDSRLDLFDRGLTVYRSGEKVAGFHWTTVEVRQQSIPLSQSATAATDYAFVLSGPDGSRAEFDEGEFANAREWGPLIQSSVTAAQLPGIVAAIDGEQTVRFGDLAVSLLELAHDGARYPWERIQTIDPRGGIVRIKVDGRWISLGPVGAIPNFYIFNEVIERLRVAAVEYPDPYGPRAVVGAPAGDTATSAAPDGGVGENGPEASAEAGSETVAQSVSPADTELGSEAAGDPGAEAAGESGPEGTAEPSPEPADAERIIERRHEIAVTAGGRSQS